MQCLDIIKALHALIILTKLAFHCAADKNDDDDDVDCY